MSRGTDWRALHLLKPFRIQCHISLRFYTVNLDLLLPRTSETHHVGRPASN